jgi:hypothetical protein
MQLRRSGGGGSNVSRNDDVVGCNCKIHLLPGPALCMRERGGKGEEKESERDGVLCVDVWTLVHKEEKDRECKHCCHCQSDHSRARSFANVPFINDFCLCRHLP